MKTIRATTLLELIGGIAGVLIIVFMIEIMLSPGSFENHKKEQEAQPGLVLPVSGVTIEHRLNIPGFWDSSAIIVLPTGERVLLLCVNGGIDKMLLLPPLPANKVEK
jgi:hypothetical protein